MPNASAHFGEEWFFSNLPRNHTIDDVVQLLFNMSKSINESDSGKKSFSNITLWDRCKNLFMVITPEEMMQVQNNESNPIIQPKDMSFVRECHDKFSYFDFVASLGRANNAHANNKAGNDCDVYLAFNGLLLGLVMLLGIGFLFYNYKDRCFRQRAQIAKDSPLLEQGDSVNDSPGSERTEQQEFLSSNRL